MSPAIKNKNKKTNKQKTRHLIILYHETPVAKKKVRKKAVRTTGMCANRHRGLVLQGDTLAADNSFSCSSALPACQEQGKGSLPHTTVHTTVGVCAATIFATAGACPCKWGYTQCVFLREFFLFEWEV